MFDVSKVIEWINKYEVRLIFVFPVVLQFVFTLTQNKGLHGNGLLKSFHK